MAPGALELQGAATSTPGLQCKAGDRAASGDTRARGSCGLPPGTTVGLYSLRSSGHCSASPDASPVGPGVAYVPLESAQARGLGGVRLMLILQVSTGWRPGFLYPEFKAVLDGLGARQTPALWAEPPQGAPCRPAAAWQMLLDHRISLPSSPAVKRKLCF